MTIANVNKTDQSAPQTESSNSRSCSRNLGPELNDSGSAKKKKHTGSTNALQNRARTAQLQAEVQQARSTHAEFVEGNQLMKMAVDADEAQQSGPSDNSDDDVDEPTSNNNSPGFFPGRQSRVVPSDSEDDESTSVKILELSDEERVQWMKELDLEMTEKFQELHSLMVQSGLKGASNYLDRNFWITEDDVRPLQPRSVSAKAGNNVNDNHRRDVGFSEVSQSVETIYKNAVEKRISSSSDECIDISDENLELIVGAGFVTGDDPTQREPTTSDGRRASRSELPRYPSAPMPQEVQMTPEEKAEQNIIEVEAAKAHMLLKPKGRSTSQNAEVELDRNKLSIAEMDEEYLVVAGHVDKLTQGKIIRGEYINFGKLLPQDRVITEEDGRLELVIHNGKTFWVLVSETVTINNFSKWEQAFRIFSNIYTRRFPSKSSELIQYNHIIHSIAGQYVWENIYSYDKEFRLHLARHPEWSWAVILQQAWTMKLCDHLSRNDSFMSCTGSQNNNHVHNSNSGSAKISEPCRRYNRGKCNFGPNCHYEHRCAYTPCGKFGHNILNCCKLIADCEKNGNKSQAGRMKRHRIMQCLIIK